MQHQPHEPSEWDWRLKMKERATPVWLALASGNPGVIFKTPASGGREKIKVQTFQFGNAAWMMSLPRRLRRCTCLIIQLLAEHMCCQFTLREAPPMATYPRRPSLRATSATCLPFSHMDFYRYAAMRVALGNRSAKHLKSRPQSRGSKLRSECNLLPECCKWRERWKRAERSPVRIQASRSKGQTW